MIAGAALLTLNNAMMKGLASNYPVGQLLFLRSIFVCPWIAIMAFHAGGLHRLAIKDLNGQLLRGSCVVGAGFLFVAGLKYLPLADAVAISFMGPLIVAAMSPILLGEEVSRNRYLAILTGFAGVLVLLRPTGDAVQWAVLFPVGAALCGSARDLITRRIAQTETSEAVLFSTTIVVIAASMLSTPFGWSPLKPFDLAILVTSGALVAAAHYLMIEAYRLGEAAVIAPIRYTSMVWAIVFGFLLFGDIPDGWALAGAAMVVFASFSITRSKTKSGV